MLEAEAGPVAQPRDDDLAPRLLVLGVGVGSAVDLDVEQMELAVDGAQLAVGSDVHAGVAVLLGPGPSFHERAGDEIEAEFPGHRARPADRLAVKGLGAGAQMLGLTEHSPLLGQADQFRAQRGRAPHEAVGGR